MKIRVTEELISKVSSMMKLEHTGEELDELVEETNQILTMMEIFNDIEINLDEVEPTYYGTVSHHAELRADEPIRDDKEVESLLEQAPYSKDNLIEVPAVLNDGEGGA